ncbi:hypothetical protein SAMN05661080_00700 [Modestobacter sp. DSM 44400]|uniref:hypothetical protein n=1 Tax=Modestobacter sp. DSM 44400 TaxID=1550230 RepID=UPI00089B7E8F|nr:hypothetical protein [Modestobacter sp. DSM 44400]SDX65542.1 hypothetical protein SAMN05661080_00700 [Modestobacter sp. DSM 44400]
MPIDAGSLHYAVGPVIAAIMVGLIALFLRWAFSYSTGSGGRPGPGPGSGEGLLTPVASLTRRESALALRAVLSDAGIRSTLREPAPHRTDVLVFLEDAERARTLAMSFRDG